MMHINIDVENSVVVLEEFKNSKDDVVDVAEPTCFHFLSVMKATYN